jgi:hypothetical protein
MHTWRSRLERGGWLQRLSNVLTIWRSAVSLQPVDLRFARSAIHLPFLVVPAHHEPRSTEGTSAPRPRPGPPVADPPPASSPHDPLDRESPAVHGSPPLPQRLSLPRTQTRLGPRFPKQIGLVDPRDIAPLSDLDKGLATFHVQGERLLDEFVLARVECAAGCSERDALPESRARRRGSRIA